MNSSSGPGVRHTIGPHGQRRFTVPGDAGGHGGDHSGANDGANLTPYRVALK